MRISDWSSDVCSSDLADLHRQVDAAPLGHLQHRLLPIRRSPVVHGLPGAERAGPLQLLVARRGDDGAGAHQGGELQGEDGNAASAQQQHRVASLQPSDVDQRSEEHTSELQSLMRISYAVFCLKKKKKHKITTT